MSLTRGLCAEIFGSDLGLLPLLLIPQGIDRTVSHVNSWHITWNYLVPWCASWLAWKISFVSDTSTYLTKLHKKQTFKIVLWGGGNGKEVLVSIYKILKAVFPVASVLWMGSLQEFYYMRRENLILKFLTNCSFSVSL